MRLLLDQGTPRGAVSELAQAGFTAIHTAEIGMAAAKDVEILRRAEQEKAVIVTLDADFHALLAHSGARQPSVIRLRIEGLRAKEFSKLLISVLQSCRDDLVAGALVSVQEKQIRVRRLPIF